MLVIAELLAHCALLAGTIMLPALVHAPGVRKSIYVALSILLAVVCLAAASTVTVDTGTYEPAVGTTNSPEVLDDDHRRDDPFAPRVDIRVPTRDAAHFGLRFLDELSRHRSGIMEPVPPGEITRLGETRPAIGQSVGMKTRVPEYLVERLKQLDAPEPTRPWTVSEHYREWSSGAVNDMARSFRQVDVTITSVRYPRTWRERLVWYLGINAIAVAAFGFALQRTRVLDRPIIS